MQLDEVMKNRLRIVHQCSPTLLELALLVSKISLVALIVDIAAAAGSGTTRANERASTSASLPHQSTM